jgi:hypothetical protein
MAWCADDRSVERSPFTSNKVANDVEASLAPYFRTLKKKPLIASTTIEEDAYNTHNEAFDSDHYCAGSENDVSTGDMQSSYDVDDGSEGTDETSSSNEPESNLDTNDWFVRSKFGDS